PVRAPRGQRVPIRSEGYGSPCSLVTLQSHPLLPLATAHSFTVLSSLPLAQGLPSGENAKDPNGVGWPLREARRCPVSASHSLTVPMSVPAANVFPSGENMTDRTQIRPLVSCRILSFSRPVATSQTLTE